MKKKSKQLKELQQYELLKLEGGNRCIPIVPTPVAPILWIQEVIIKLLG